MIQIYIYICIQHPGKGEIVKFLKRPMGDEWVRIGRYSTEDL
jgi:hypothetical protein